jgi:(2Fe-2S) ferredoxin
MDNSTCICPPKGEQNVVGRIRDGAPDAVANNTTVATNVGLQANGARINSPVPTKSSVSIDGSGNKVRNSEIDSQVETSIVVGSGSGNAVTDVDMTLFSGTPPILVPNLSPPVSLSYIDNGSSCTISGAFSGLPNQRYKIQFFAVDKFILDGIEETSYIPLGFLSNEVITNANGIGTLNLTLVGDDYYAFKTFRKDGFAWTVTSVNQSGTPLETFPMSPVSIPPKAPFNFDNDTKTDIAVYRKGAGANDLSYWHILNSSDNTYRQVQFGNGEDKIVPGDFTGEGETDFAVFRPSSGTWYFSEFAGEPSRNFDAFPFGALNDIPLIGDFDADNRNDLAVFRNGTWWIRLSLSGEVLALPFGLGSDKQVAADYNGDGRTDIAVYRNGVWYISVCPTCAVRYGYFGLATDKPVPADYDDDGKADLAVYRDGTWYIQRSTAGFTAIQFGLATDIPLRGDFDADGKVDIAVYRPADGTWYVLKSSGGVIYGVPFGSSGDIPVPGAGLP